MSVIADIEEVESTAPGVENNCKSSHGRIKYNNKLSFNYLTS